MRRLIIATALTATLGCTATLAAAAPEMGSPAQQPTTGKGATMSGLSPWIVVTSANDLIGRRLRDPQAQGAGKINSLVVDLGSGQVLYAIIGSDGSFDIDDKYVAVPFTALQLTPRDDLMNVMIPAGKLSKAQRVAQAQISAFGEPGDVDKVFNQYDMLSGWASKAADARPGQYLLVRHEEIIRLKPSKNMAANVKGANVNGSDGAEIGEIDHIVIDPATGHIAYLLLSHGGFLGLGEEWLPLPPQAIAWSAKDDAFILNAKAPEATQRQAFAKTNVPFQIRRVELQSFYKRYGVTPYWEQD